MNEPQRFGDFWTVQKLDAVEKYLEFYTTALKKQSFKLCYIDAFSGSGNVMLKDGQVIDGSAIRALKYPFDQYYFFEKDKKFYDALLNKIHISFSDKMDHIRLIHGDCNDLLLGIDDFSWMANKWRGVIFLDPYAMDLSWLCLENISRTKAFDVWYLFPFSAVNRNLPNSGEIRPANENILTKIFGSADWKSKIYTESRQQTIFEEPGLEKVPVDGLKQYVLSRLKDTFYTVAPNPALLKNEKNSPLFLLCFAGSNPSKAAQELSLKGAKHILEKI